MKQKLYSFFVVQGFSKISLFLILLFLLNVNFVHATIKRDTIAKAKSLIKDQKFKQAEKLLCLYTANHTNDLNPLWLYAQCAYWSGHMNTFHKVYRQAISSFPANYYLKLDYALKLLENGDLKEALPLFKSYQQYDSSSNDLKLAFATMNYWQGNFRKSIEQLSILSNKNWGSKDKAIALLNEVRNANAFYLTIACDINKDDQPLQRFSPSIELGKYVNNFFAPSLSYTSPLFFQQRSTSRMQEISLSNSSSIFNSSFQSIVKAGLIQFPNNSKVFCGRAEISQTIFKFARLDAKFSYQPYSNTLSSLDTNIMYKDYEISLGWNNIRSWNGKVFASLNQFPDNNSISNFGAWLFAPPIKWSSLAIRIGYAFGNSTSKESRYQSKLSLLDIIMNSYNGDTIIKGIYNPYFTPKNQTAHSALLSLNYTPHQSITMGANASIAFYGNTKNPYLFLDLNSSKDIYINQNYSNLIFRPIEFSSFILIKLSIKSNLKINYSFVKNNFYSSHLAGLTFKTNIWNEKKKK